MYASRKNLGFGSSLFEFAQKFVFTPCSIISIHNHDGKLKTSFKTLLRDVMST